MDLWRGEKGVLPFVIQNTHYYRYGTEKIGGIHDQICHCCCGSFDRWRPSRYCSAKEQREKELSPDGIKLTKEEK